MIRAYLCLIVKISQDHMLRCYTIINPVFWYKENIIPVSSSRKRGIRTGQQAQDKGLAGLPIPAYIVVDVTVEYNQEMRLKLSRK